MNILVTDGTFKHTLAAVRALGRSGHLVDVVAYRPGACAAHSRYCHRSFVGPSTYQEEPFFLFLQDLLQRNKYDVLIPIGSASTKVVSQNREQLAPLVQFLLPSHENYEIAADKNKTIQHAQQVNVPVPQTFWPRSATDLAEIGRSAQFPLVMKLPFDSGQVLYVNDPQELQTRVNQLTSANSTAWSDFMLQEYIQGDGYGFFALLQHGKICAQFMHKRLLEYPVTGGASVKAESFYDQHLAELGTRLLTSLQWNGIAMVEFKRDKITQEYKLMEINPKFWGSLELAIASGVNFPELYCRAAVGEQIPPQPLYQVGLQFRWMIRESLFSTLVHPTTLPAWIQDGLNPQIKKDIEWSDILPHFFQLGATIAELGVRIVNNKLFFPYGRPQLKGRS